MSDVDELVRATVKIVGKTTGTGFFVAPDHVVTCEHVAGAAGMTVTVHCYEAVAQPGPGESPHRLVARDGKVVAAEELADIALVKVMLAEADRWPVLSLADAVASRHGTWDSYGFPTAVGPVVTVGHVRNVAASDARRRAAIQLYSVDAAAGRGAALAGYSGAAARSGGQVIGQLRTSPQDDDGLTREGLVFATPSSNLVRLMAAHGLATTALHMDERLKRVKQRITGALTPCPGLRASLARRLGCEGAEVVDRLVTRPGADVARLLLFVMLDDLRSAPSSEDRDALHAVLGTVLPFATDLREVIAQWPRAPVDRSSVTLNYRTATIAELVMAGWVERKPEFHIDGREPRGVSAVSLPAIAQTAVLTSHAKLREGVIDVLAGRAGTTETDPATKANVVERWLRREAELGPVRNRNLAPTAKEVSPVRYYVTFRDDDHKENAEAMWEMTLQALHGADGLPSLVLVRLAGSDRPEETDMVWDIVELLKL